MCQQWYPSLEARVAERAVVSMRKEGDDKIGLPSVEIGEMQDVQLDMLIKQLKMCSTWNKSDIKVKRKGLNQ
jgi:hypothetical protein